MSLSENIKNARLNLNLTLEDLSKKTGISMWSLERYESGQINVPKINIGKIANSLDTTTTNLLCENEPIIQPTETSDFIMNISSLIENSNEIIETDDSNIECDNLIDRYNNLSDSNKSRLLEFLDVLENS